MNTLEDKLGLLTQTKKDLKLSLGIREDIPFSKFIDYIPFTPYKLFTGNKLGVWYDPSDLSTMYQDFYGSIPVTKNGDPVGLILDKSKGLELGAELLINGDFKNDINNWKNYGVDKASVVNGRLQANGELRFYQDVNVEVGKSYRVVSDFDNSIEPLEVNGIRYIIYDNHAFSNSIISTYNNEIKSLVSTTGKLRIYLYSNAPTNVTIGKISLREIKGNHAKQTVSAARPLYRSGDGRGLVNALYSTEDLNVGWYLGTITPKTVTNIAPPIKNAAVQELKVTSTGGSAVIRQGYNATEFLQTPHTFSSSVYVKAGTYNYVRLSISTAANATPSLTINLSTGEYTSRAFIDSGNTATVDNVGNGWYRVSINRVSSEYRYDCFTLYLTDYSGASATNPDELPIGSTVYIAAPQFERFPEGTTNPLPTAYQANTSGFREGIATGKDTDNHWLDFDGIDDCLLANISMSKNMLWSMGVNVLSNGYLMTQADSPSNRLGIYSASSGLLSILHYDGDSYRNVTKSINKNTFIFISEVKTDTKQFELYANSAGNISNASSGLGYITNGMYIGRRSEDGGTQYYTNMRVYSILRLDSDITTVNRELVKSYLANKTGVTL